MAAPRIRIKRSSVQGRKPTNLELGQLALNTYDAELYIKRERPGIGTDIVSVSVGSSVKNTVYVTKDGKDTNTGLKLGDAKATIKAAVAIAKAGTTIQISAGDYQEDNPITIPDQVSVTGTNLREVSILPLNSDKDLFYWGAGNEFENASFYGAMPGKAIFSFDPKEQRYINQSPYVRNCTNFIPGSIGMQIDGDIVIGPLKSMVVDSYTQYNQGGIGVSITNSAYAQLVSIFTICDNIAIYCGSGGACDLTNSNSSFGTYGMIADGVSPMKFLGIVTATAGADSDRFDIDLSTPTFNVVNALYDNVSGIATIYTNAPHRFNVGMSVTISGLGFTCPTSAGILTYPSGSKGYTFEVKTVAPGRFIDASNMIKLNKQEIVDKSLAAIAINHPDFYFPFDSQTNSRSRYYDAYRLIQQNKQEIVEKSLASIAIFNSDFYFPGDSQTNGRSRYYDAYRLIQQNKTEIVNTAWNNALTQYPGISTTATKCKRDLGYFVDAVSTDVFTGGNNYSREFVKQYFTGAGVPISNGLVGEETQSIFTFQEARELVKLAITNNLSIKDLTVSVGPSAFAGVGGSIPNTNPNACADVQSNVDNLVGIITTVIGAGSLVGLPAVNVGTFTTGGSKCYRDLGYFVDAVSIDVFTGGNNYAREFVRQYFNNSGQPISNGLVGEESESIAAFMKARDFMKLAITNNLNVKDLTVTAGYANTVGIGSTIPNTDTGACFNVQSNIDNLSGIVTTVLGSGNLTGLPNLSSNTFTEGGSKCARDIGYIVDAIASDLVNYTNREIIKSTKSYFNRNGTPISNGLVGEVSESITAFIAARDYAKLAVNNQLNNKNYTLAPDPLTGFNTSPNSCANVLTMIDNLAGILTVNLGNGNLNSLPSVSLASTVFSVNVGIATQKHYYNSGGITKCSTIRPFDGQVVYFGDLTYDIDTITVGAGGTGYTFAPSITIEDPDSSWGVAAQAVAEISNGSVSTIEIVSSGRGYTRAPRITIEGPSVGFNTARLIASVRPTYYSVARAEPLGNDKYRVFFNENVPAFIGIGTEVPFYKQSRILASGHSFQYIGAGDYIDNALPWLGGLPIQENEAVSKNGGLVVYTSTDQSGNFRIGNGVIVNQNTGTVSGSSYTKSLFSTLTPFILALGGD
jgi:hypothetical protein